MSWTTPTWAYPALRNEDFDMGQLLPYSVITAYQEGKVFRSLGLNSHQH
jgi:hypothetical protein